MIIESGNVPQLLNRVAEQTKADVLVIGHSPMRGHLGDNGNGYGIIRASQIPAMETESSRAATSRFCAVVPVGRKSQIGITLVDATIALDPGLNTHCGKVRGPGHAAVCLGLLGSSDRRFQIIIVLERSWEGRDYEVSVV